MPKVTMREMLDAGVHFGHQTRYWDPKMGPYLFGHRNKIHIIDLEKTLPLYEEAVNFIGTLAAKKGNILFVGTKRSAQAIIKEEAERCGVPYVNRRWLGGLLTNFKTVRRSINRLKELETMQTDGSFDRISKKERLTHTRELEKLNDSLFGIKDMPGIPDALFVIDVGYESIAVNEARKLGILVVGIVDSNSSPDGIDYIIPGNDDALRSIRLYTKGMVDAILEGRASVANVADGGDENEYVELDETGNPIEFDRGERIPESEDIAKASKKRALTSPPVEAKPEQKGVAEETPGATEKQAVKKKVRKKIVKKAKKKVVVKVAESADEKPAARKSTGEEPVKGKPAREKPVEAEGKSTGEEPVKGEPAKGNPVEAEGKSTGEEPVKGEPAEGNPVEAEGKSTGEEPAKGEPAEGNPVEAEGKSTGEELLEAGGKSTDDGSGKDA